LKKKKIFSDFMAPEDFNDHLNLLTDLRNSNVGVFP